MASIDKVYLVMSPLAVGDSSGEHHDRLKMLATGETQQDWTLRMRGAREGGSDALLVRHWAVRVRDQYFELEREKTDNNGVKLDVKTVSESRRIISSTLGLGYTHLTDEEIVSLGMYLTWIFGNQQAATAKRQNRQ